MAAQAYAYARTFAHTHAIVFLSDNLRNTLREVIRENGISPNKLMQDWETIELGIRTWLQSGHLNNIVVEFFKPGAWVSSARWEFPIGYAGSGVDDDMWLDKNYLRQLIAKSARPSTDCTYRILLCTAPGRPYVEGFSDCSFLSTGNLVARQAGTVIATGYMTAAVTYWR
jgi:HORMA domain-containing protein